MLSMIVACGSASPDGLYGEPGQDASLVRIATFSTGGHSSGGGGGGSPAEESGAGGATANGGGAGGSNADGSAVSGAPPEDSGSGPCDEKHDDKAGKGKGKHDC